MRNQTRKGLPIKRKSERTNKMLIIGIDTGVNTGLSIFNIATSKLEFVASMAIHKAMRIVQESKPLFVRVEDARKRKWVTGGREKLQGAGSVKRDAKIWEDFLTDENIPFEMVAPKNNKTKSDARAFMRETGWTKPTNEHGRDAAMLVYGLSANYLKIL